MLISFFPIIVANLLAIMLGFYLYKNYAKLGTKKMKDRVGNSYSTLSLRRDKYYVIIFPLFILHRTVYVFIGSFFIHNAGIGLQILVFINLLTTMFLLSSYEHKSRYGVYRVRFNDVSTHFIFLWLFMFTDFVTTPFAQQLYGFVFLGLVFLMVIINLFFIVHDSIKSLMQRRKLKMIKREKMIERDCNAESDSSDKGDE